MMRKKITLFATLALGMLLMCACSKKDDVVDEYTSLTVEQNKQAIEAAGTTFLSQADGVKNLSALNVLNDFTNLGSNPKVAPVRDLVASFTAIQQDVSAAMQLHVAARKITTLADYFNNNTGIRTYNTTTDEWDMTTASSTEVTFVFASGKYSKASITINNFSSSTSPISFYVGEYSGVLLKSITFTIKGDGTTLGTIALTGAYNSDGTPSKLTETLSFVEGYTFNTTFTNTGTVVNYDQSFTNGTTELYSAHFDGKGDFSYNTITNTDMDDEDNIAKIISGANVWIKVGNVQIIGQIDIKSLLDALPSTIDKSKQADIDNEVSLFNKYSSIYAKYVDDNKTIAKSEFYTLPKTYQSYDNTTQKYVTKTYYQSDLRLKFKDGSYIDNAFFNTGFEAFMTQLQTLANACAKNYGN
jgi:hypothetical protein